MYEIEYIVVKFADFSKRYESDEYEFFVNWDKNMVIVTPLEDRSERDIFPLFSVVKIHEVKSAQE